MRGEQIPFRFEQDPGSNIPQQPEHLEILTDDALRAMYKEKVGVSARPGRDGREQLISAIQNPSAERDALHELDTTDDKADLRNLYRH
jgi:hypothetical protein